jgi:hypothetical protein
VQVTLWEGDFYVCFAESRVDRGVQIVNHLQAILHAWQERSQHEVQLELLLPPMGGLGRVART